MNLLAAVTTTIPDLAKEGVSSEVLPPSGGDMLLVMGVGIAISALVFLLIYLRWSRRRDRSVARTGARFGARSRSQSEKGPEGSRSSFKLWPKRHHHRRHRHEYGRRNPTLAETGGLPPSRSGDASNPAP